MKIAVVGASGWLGNLIAREALARGHEVKGIARDAARIEGLGDSPVSGLDATDPEDLGAAISGYDAVVVAVTDRSGPERSVIPAMARSVIAALPALGVPRLLFVGGGGSLEIAPGHRLVDQPGFPDQYKAEALAQAEALDLLRAEGGELRWSYLSPPPEHLEPGEPRGGYRAAGGDAPVTDAAGESRITAGDFAAAAVDELEQSAFVGQRFTAAYA
jgi:putative NADH-flavin reductase